MTLRLSAEVDRALTDAAAKAQVSKQQFVEQAVAEKLGRDAHTIRMRALAEGIAVEDAELLERLSQ